MAETKCLTDGRRGRPWSNLNLKTRRTESRRSPLEVLQGRVGRPRGTTTPHFICGDLGFKTSCAQGKVGLTNFHKWATCYPQLSGCTKRAHRQPERRWKDFAWAALGTEDATHPKRGFGRGAAPRRGPQKLP